MFVVWIILSGYSARVEKYDLMENNTRWMTERAVKSLTRILVMLSKWYCYLKVVECEQP